jgi:phosphinothricin acetyltransferase
VSGSPSNIQIIDCDEWFSDAILAILNDEILNSVSLYDYEPRTPGMMAEWFRIKRENNFPIIGAIDEAGDLLGFATYSSFRPHKGYHRTIEHSVYVRSNSRGSGVGSRLLGAIIDRARSQQFHVMIGGIDAGNSESIALHEKFGFQRVGLLPQVGWKFDRWLDLAFYQLSL